MRNPACAITLKVGDTVNWSGCWGSEAPKPVKVIAIELCSEPRSKYGELVNEAAWDIRDYLCVSLDNGHWAYGEQISPL